MLAMASNLKVRMMLSLAYGCGLRAGEVVRLRRAYRQRAEDHSGRTVQGPQGPQCDAVCRDPRSVAAMVEGAPIEKEAGTPVEERWLFPGAKLASR